MKKILNHSVILLAAAVTILPACSTTKKMSNQQKGAAVGATGGAALGGIIGNNVGKKGNTVLGALIGAVVAGVLFLTNQYAVTPNSRLALDKLVKVFNQYPETNILIEGHTDNVGTEAYNMTLSQKRAEAVGDYLKSAGIPAERLTIKWYGETEPKVDNTTDANRAQNRRVEFAITADEKMKAEAKQATQKN